MKFRNPFRSQTDAATAELLDRATSPRPYPPPGVKFEPIVPPTVGTANMETSAGRIQIRVEAMSGRLVRQVLLAAAAQAECFPDAHPHARASSGFKAAIDEVMRPLVAGEPDAPGAPQASAAPRPADGPPEAPIATEAGSGPPEAARSTFIPPLDSVVAAMVGETPWGEKVYGLDRLGLPEFPPNFIRMIDEADARHHADREAERAAVRLPDEGPPVIAGVILDDPMPPRSCRPSPVQKETQKAALANVATASKAAAADPDSATLSATLAGMRAAEDAVFEALNGFESKFRGCVASDIRIERCAQLNGSSRIASVLIDLKLQNVQP